MASYYVKIVKNRLAKWIDYARFREDDRGACYYSNDYDRGLRQQEVVRALVDGIMSVEVLQKSIC
ncbi:hypothetical protein [Chengkuizengella marina]|uniref:Uncharacterized protein n=1 Tax=Chengkuizengella marina TaxID=2507566 RepID=A0A6N9PXA2_9BACL|nr:hypothetical protein [Chengkuizengella marina]NBI28139.1 hypothetical protein [Chengkuizengella marina]